jgi:hypothetical protein
MKCIMARKEEFILPTIDISYTMYNNVNGEVTNVC